MVIVHNMKNFSNHLILKLWKTDECMNRKALRSHVPVSP
jgi:hypothetical protein